MRSIILSTSFALGCVPAKVLSVGIDDESESDTNNDVSEEQSQMDDTGAGGSGNNNESEDQIGDSDNSEGATSNGVINDGVWSLTEALLVNDPCWWLEVIPNFGDGVVAVSLEKLLPESFDVEAMNDSFEIKARSYRARDFIECNVENSSFTCETQTADAARYYFDGFNYYIDFTGTVIDANTIQGVAVVSYSIDNGSWWVDFIENYVENTQDYLNECTQTLELTIDRNE
tara:strand:+ start:23 stop:712 length:690 start_codon:yes stop_codon:yes gene_type:complete